MTLTTEWQLLGEDYIVSSHGDLYVRLYARYSEQQIENNRTWVMYEIRSYFTGSYIISQTPTTATLSGTGIGEITKNYNDFLGGSDGYFYNGETTLISLGAWIPHDDITGEATVTASGEFYAGPWNGSTGIIEDITVSLPTIPRATPAPNITAYVENKAKLVLEPKSPVFRHIVEIKFGSISKYLNSSGELVDMQAVLQPSIGSVDFTIPTSFYEEFSTQQADGQIIVTTQQQATNGSWNTVSEPKTGILTIMCPEKCKPILHSYEIIDINPLSIEVTGNDKYLVRLISTAQITINTSASGGVNDTNTTIESILVNGVLAENKVAEAEAMLPELLAENKVAKIPNVETNIFTIEITNSRDMTTIMDVSNGGRFIPYFPPSYEGSIYRVEPTTGEVRFEYSGMYYNGIINVVDNRENNIAILYRYKKKGETEWTTPSDFMISEHEYVGEYGYQGDVVFGENFDYTSQYDIEITVTDRFTTFTRIHTITRGLPVFWWSEDSFNVLGDLTINNTSIIDLIYPVGSIYMSTNDVNPSTYLGGTWEAWGSGRVPIGVDTSQEEFDQVEKTGGEKTHTLTENEMPRHRHIVGNYNEGGVENPEFGAFAQQGGSIGWWSNINTSYKGNSEPHNILQPYITCYMWKRTR